MNKYLYIFILSILASETEASAQINGTQNNDVPRLVVNISIDQLRSDYMEAFMPLYGEDGLKRLLAEGRIYTQPTYPFAPVDRASASAALSTGTTPYYNGVPSAEWLSRKTLRPVRCTAADGSTTPSPKALSVTTIGDELKVASHGAAKVYAIAAEQDAAIMSAGHAADAAFWVNPKDGKWCSSAFYIKTTPPWVDAFNRLNAPAQKAGSTWKAIDGITANCSYFPSSGVIKPFSHTFAGNKQFLDYTTSALINSDITTLALQCQSSTAMGIDDVTDMLSLQYYAGTFCHQNTNDVQLELQDTYVRLDRAIAQLVTTLEQRVGKDHLLFVITSTGYYDDVVTDLSQYRIPTGTFYINRTAGYLNMYLAAIYGQGNYVEAYHGNHIYLNLTTIEQKHIQLSDILGRAREMLLMSDGVRDAYTSLGLLSNSNAEADMMRNGYCIGISGDIIVEVAPGWKVFNEDNQQETKARQACVAFPVIFYGAGIQHETVSTPVKMTQIAPDICKSIRIRAPNACKSAPLH